MAWTRNRPLGLVYRDASLCHDGYTLFSSVEGYHATLIDSLGRIVHRWTHGEGIQYAQLLPSGNLLFHTAPPSHTVEPEEVSPVGVIGGAAHALIELDWDGNTVWEFRDKQQHHDFVRLPNGNTLILFWEVLPDEVRRQVRGGYQAPDDPDIMLGDLAREIASDGTVIREWRSWEHFDYARDVLCPLERRREWTHANSIFQTADGRWLISFRQTNTVVLVDPESGDIDWKWGPDTLAHQHHAQMLPNGNVLIFDNGTHRRGAPGFSRVVEVNPETNEIVWTYQAEILLAFVSFMVSGAERLSNSGTLITEGATGRIFEVTADGETVWEYVSGFTPAGRFGPTPAVFRAHRFEADDPRFVGRVLDHRRWESATEQLARGEHPY